MNILLTLLIIFLLFLISDKLKKVLVYRDSPADPDYVNCLVTITFIITDVKKVHKDESVELQHVFYAHKKLNSEAIINYIDSHTKQLYHLEIKNMELNYRRKFGATPLIKSKEIKIKLL